METLKAIATKTVEERVKLAISVCAKMENDMRDKRDEAVREGDYSKAADLDSYAGGMRQALAFFEILA